MAAQALEHPLFEASIRDKSKEAAGNLSLAKHVAIFYAHWVSDSQKFTPIIYIYITYIYNILYIYNIYIYNILYIYIHIYILYYKYYIIYCRYVHSLHIYIYIYNPQWFNTSLPSHRFWRSPRASPVQVTASEHVSLDFEKEPDLDEAPKSPQVWRAKSHRKYDCSQYPLVMTNIAIEHGHWNSGFTHQKWWIFPVRYVKLPEGSLFDETLCIFMP